MGIIDLNGIIKTFKCHGQVTEALKGAGFQVGEGEFLSIVGTSGSGKTTLLNIIGLLEEKSSGTYLLDDQPIEGLSEKEMARYRNEYFGFVVQDFALLNDYRVMDNIRLPLEYNRKKLSRKEMEEKVRTLASQLGILDKLKQPVRNLSGGEKQRVAIARALVNDPKVILADEPTGSLDKRTTEEIMEIFAGLHKAGRTIILITHDEKVAARSERILHLEDGMIADESI